MNQWDLIVIGAGAVGSAALRAASEAGARLLAGYRSIAPGLAGSPVAAATCLYTMSPDGQFLVGRPRGFRRTHFAAGLSGHGFKLAPALGDVLVDLALHGRTELPIGFLSPASFDGASP